VDVLFVTMIVWLYLSFFFIKQYCFILTYAMHVEAMMFILDFLGLLMTKMSLEKPILNPYGMNI
jgi:hypothetical protein